MHLHKLPKSIEWNQSKLLIQNNEKILMKKGRFMQNHKQKIKYFIDEESLQIDSKHKYVVNNPNKKPATQKYSKTIA